MISTSSLRSNGITANLIRKLLKWNRQVAHVITLHSGPCGIQLEKKLVSCADCIIHNIQITVKFKEQLKGLTPTHIIKDDAITGVFYRLIITQAQISA